MLGYRADGDEVKDMPATRRIMPFILERRNDAVVYFKQTIPIDATRTALAAFRERTGLRATLLHVIIFAIAKSLHARPRLNRFVVGKRLYQRRGVWVSFSAKKAKDDDAPVIVVKKEVQPDWSFEELVRHIEGGIDDGRSEAKSSTDKELGLLFLFPHIVVRFIVALLWKLDIWGLLPGALIRQDPMYASVLVANLGSIEMDAAYHHLYEYGTIPIFAVAGRADDGDDAALCIKYAFDERVEDGLYAAQSLEIVRDVIAAASFDAG